MTLDYIGAKHLGFEGNRIQTEKLFSINSARFLVNVSQQSFSHGLKNEFSVTYDLDGSVLIWLEVFCSQAVSKNVGSG